MQFCKLELSDSYVVILPSFEAKFIAYGKSAAFIAAVSDESAILADAHKIKQTPKVIVSNIFEPDAGRLADRRPACHMTRAPKKK